MKLKRLNKRGFSLVEVIIAMAVVSIVTFAALSIIYPATDKTVEANAQSNAIYFASDAIECFKATKDSDEFFAALYYRMGIEDKQKQTLHTLIEEKGEEKIYSIPIDNKWKAIIALKYDTTDLEVNPEAKLYDRITIAIESNVVPGKFLLDPVKVTCKRGGD